MNFWKKLITILVVFLGTVALQQSPVFAACEGLNGSQLISCVNTNYPNVEVACDPNSCDCAQATGILTGPQAQGAGCGICGEYRGNASRTDFADICYAQNASACTSNSCSITYNSTSEVAVIDTTCLTPGTYNFVIDAIQNGNQRQTFQTTPFAKSSTSRTRSIPVNPINTDSLTMDLWVKDATGNNLCQLPRQPVSDPPSANPLPDFDYCLQVPLEQQEACKKCVGEDPSESGNLYTAVGCVRVDEQGLAADLIRLLLGVAGGVALLSILAGAFMFTTSQGESNRVKQAKERITAAVSGLLFIIFVVIILDFIGVRILQIPGLG